MTRIYALMCGQLVLYVGQTICTLRKRETEHRSKGNKTYSKYIPKDMEWEIKLLEECEDDIATMREQYYYDTLKPFYNRQRPGQTKKEYKRKYRQTEACKESQRKWNKKYYAAKKAEESSA
jgi:predicted GIY-YIG superfamily endonuclease